MIFKAKEDKKTVEMICKLAASLEADKSNWKSHWKDLTDYFYPDNNNVFGGQTTGEKKFQRLMDSIGVDCVKKLVDFIHGSIFNPSEAMAYLTTTDEALDNESSVAKYLEEVQKIMHLMIHNSNVPTEAHTFLMEIITLGTSFCTFEEDEEIGINMRARPIYECNFIEDYKGSADGVIFEKKLTAEQIIEEYGLENSIEQLTRDCSTNPTKKYCIVVYVNRTKRMPEPYKHPTMEYSTIHCIKELGYVVKLSGFHEKPFSITRYKKVSGESYGRCPAMEAYPDVKTCDSMMRTWVQGGELAILPPLQAPDEGVLLPIKFVPAGMNYYRADSKDRVEPIYTGGDPRIGREIIEYMHDKIKSIFYIDQIHLVENDRMTTTEVLTRNDEAYRVFAPFIRRFEDEFLSVLFVKVMGICQRHNLFPPMPPVLQQSGKVIEIKFSSVVKKAQQSMQAENIVRAFTSVRSMAEIDSSVNDVLDLDAHVKLLYRSLSAPAVLLRDEEDYNRIRELRAQASAESRAVQDNEIAARASNQNAQADAVAANVGG